MITGDNKLQEKAKQTATKEPEDTDVISTIQKMIKGLDEEIETFTNAGRMETVDTLKHQKEVLSKFLPTMLTEDEIKQIISTLEDKSVPSVMKYFKQNYAGKCDMKQVNLLARNA
jgi:uncharacterized protein YqeY